MTTFASPSPARLRELDEATHEAWLAYSDALRDLTGADYEAAEHAAWEQLQRALEPLRRERGEPVAPA